MALYHFHAGVVTRSAGSSVVASAAYRAGEKLHSAYYGEDADYTRKGGVIYTEIFLLPNAPNEYKDRETLWNAVEKAEKHPRAQLAYAYDFALQNELTLDENIALARRFVEEQFVSKGMVVDFAVHAPDKRDGGIPNPHAHLLCPMRPLDGNGEWGAKQHRVYRVDDHGERVRDKAGRYVFDAVPTTDWGEKETLLHWRKEWANYINLAFEQKGLSCRVDYRSLEEQGSDRLPTIHEGPAVRTMEARGIATDKGDFNRWIKETNAALQKLRWKIKDLLAWLKEIKKALSAPREPTLAEYLSAYYDERNAGAWSNKAKVNNLKEYADIYNFLTERRLSNVDDLLSYTTGIDKKLSKMNADLSRKKKRMDELNKLLRRAEDYREYKPLAAQLSAIKFKKRREDFQRAHGRELTLFYIAERELKPHFTKEGKLPLTAWKNELAKLTEERAAISATYSALYHESMELLNIRKRVEDIRRRQERTQHRQQHYER